MLKIGDEVIINQEYMENKQYVFDLFYSFVLQNYNKIFKIYKTDKDYNRKNFYYLEDNCKFCFSEEELIPILPIKIRKLIEEINAENRR